MTYDELVECIGWGYELFFYYNDDKYWISQNPGKRYLTRAKDSYTQEFDSAEELFKYGRVEGKSILEIWDLIKDQL